MLSSATIRWIFQSNGYFQSKQIGMPSHDDMTERADHQSQSGELACFDANHSERGRFMVENAFAGSQVRYYAIGGKP
jgi:hypothetical protein